MKSTTCRSRNSLFILVDKKGALFLKIKVTPNHLTAKELATLIACEATQRSLRRVSDAEQRKGACDAYRMQSNAKELATLIGCEATQRSLRRYRMQSNAKELATLSDAKQRKGAGADPLILVKRQLF